jgi:hypothetical protein
MINTLAVTGGHSFDEEAYLGLLESLDGVTCRHVSQPVAIGRYREPADAWLMYDAFLTYDDEGKKVFAEKIAGGQGVVFLHHTIGNHLDWKEYPRILGGLWNFSAFEIDGVKYGPSTAQIDVDFDVHVEAKEHPVVRGIEDFSINEEIYAGIYVDPKATVLLSTSHPKATPQIAWARTYGKARIVYIQLGHGPSTYKMPVFRRLLSNALHWVAHVEKSD